MSKVKDLISKHGLSYKSFFVIFFVFTPACFVVAWKMPNISTVARTSLLLITVAWLGLQVAIIIGGGMSLSEMLLS